MNIQSISAALGCKVDELRVEMVLTTEKNSIGRRTATILLVVKSSLR